MKRRETLITLITFCLWLAACSNPTDDSEQIRKSETVKYHDRNGDGKVDIERHRFRGFSDLDWELRDDDFNGTFEAKWHYGVGLRKTPTNAAVPTNVTISPE